MGDNKPTTDDWRRQGQERFLNKVKLIAKKYHPYRHDWEHDHCEFCGAKFSLREGDLKLGYSTQDGYHWICNECFIDFKDEFDWDVKKEA